jgi:Family of unknown function (DUF5343)
MNDNGTAGRDLPPYLGFQTLKNFLEALRQGIPQRIDRSMMRTLGGTVQKQLLHALQYLGFTSEAGIPQEALKRLVSADGVEQQQVWRQALEGAYPFLYGEEALGFDLSTATAGQLTEKFKTLGIQGDTVRKAEAFFLRAADEAGMTISPHIPKRISKPRRALGQIGKARNGYKPRKRRSVEDSQSMPTVTNSSPPVNQRQVSMASQGDARQALLQSLVTKMPEFDPKWDDEAKKRWLETFDRVAERLLALPHEA